MFFQFVFLFASKVTNTISGRLLKRMGIILLPIPRLTTMSVFPSLYTPASYLGKNP